MKMTQSSSKLILFNDFLVELEPPQQVSDLDDCFCDGKALILTEIHLIIKVFKLKQVLNLSSHVIKIRLISGASSPATSKLHTSGRTSSLALVSIIMLGEG